MKLGNTRISRNVICTTFSNWKNKDIKITAKSLFVLFLLGETKQFMLYVFTHTPVMLRPCPQDTEADQSY